jgi:hypothetical protein
MFTNASSRNMIRSTRELFTPQNSPHCVQNGRENQKIRRLYQNRHQSLRRGAERSQWSTGGLVFTVAAELLEELDD